MHSAALKKIGKWRAELVAGRQHSIDSIFRERRLAEPLITWNPSSNALQAATNQLLLDYWRSLCRSGQIPASVPIDPLALGSALGYVHVAEPLNAGSDFVYRIYGGLAGAASGMEMTRRKMSERIAHNLPADLALAVCGAVYDRQMPLMIQRVADDEPGVHHWERIVLPFIDDAGVVARIIIGAVPFDTYGRIVGGGF